MSSNAQVPSSSTADHSESALPRMMDLSNDTLGRIHPNDLDDMLDESDQQNDAHVLDNTQVDNNINKNVEDAMQPLYPDCDGQHTKLSSVVELLSIKSRHKGSEALFTELLQFMKKVLPDGCTLPENCQKATAIIKPYRMSYEIIHACPNDYILYWRENADRDSCPNCNVSRWKPHDPSKPVSKNVPVKKLRYFSVTKRLQRMYSIPWIAKEMSWHSRVENYNTHMRHPVDSPSWKKVDRLWPSFADETRNVRLGLATDGFNPFGTNDPHSCWHAMLVPYNIPTSLYMSQDFTMLTLLIPGPYDPEHNIDVYLQPLIEELKELWSVGSTTYDAKMKSDFTMKVLLMWCMHDFPAYAHVSGCRTAGEYVCPVCSEQIDSQWLKYGRKFVYMGVCG
ncbi:uncharacterized protein LOC113334514 isoform X1 [Papaver somniferum]|uniref:uncharacterized protein LOC113334514 isoform X1 n=1 Tax=Papaver somniferum TaxID=3469 RepID=UPI000E6FC83E|nr:uncharacterized protein LOC113334514 isoform X1 [Papaver somniferum]XP_026436530.1 uncharacterized protein LOC113334514 isoform X1 [Papaver somniferum]